MARRPTRRPDRRRRAALRGGLLAAAALILAIAVVNRDTAAGFGGLVDLLAGANRAPTSRERAASESASGTAPLVLPESSRTDGEAAGTAAAGAKSARFGVSVAPLALEAGDARAEVAFDLLYETFVAELGAIPNLRLVDVESTGAGANPDEVDFTLALTAASRTGSPPSWSLGVDWIATRDGRGTWSTSGSEPLPADVKEVARKAADALRDYPFPPAETRALELEGLLLDANLADETRYKALDELRRLPERFAFVGRDEQRMVSVAATEIVVNVDDPEVRARVWQAMENVEDTYLVGPLVDSLMNDPSERVRIQAVRLLAKNFADDPRARSTLDYVLASDISPAVKTHARWESLDLPGRREYLAATLLNPALPDAERIELLAADVAGIRRYLERPAFDALVEIANRAQPAAQVPGRDPDRGRLDLAYVVGPLVEFLEESTLEEMRFQAAMALLRHVDEPGVRDALERAARADRSYGLRRQISGWLQQTDTRRARD